MDRCSKSHGKSQKRDRQEKKYPSNIRHETRNSVVVWEDNVWSCWWSWWWRRWWWWWWWWWLCEDENIADYDVVEVDVEEEGWSHDRDPHFVRACAVEMHFKIAPEPCHAEKDWQHAAGQGRGATLCPSLRSRNALGHCTKAMQEFRTKLPEPRAPWSSTGLSFCRKSPSVWTNCLEKKV